jgi:hypothetical protein
MATKPGTDNSWTEPESAANTDYQPIYPYNNVQVTESGHSFEMDDTPTRERVRLQHRSGTFIEMHPNGDEVHKVYGNGYEITIKDKNVLIKGTCNIEIQGDANIHAVNDLNLKVGGDFNLEVGGNMYARAHGSRGMEFVSDSDMLITSNPNFGGALRLNTGSNLYLAGDLNVGGSITADVITAESRVGTGPLGGVSAGLAGFTSGTGGLSLGIPTPATPVAVPGSIFTVGPINSASAVLAPTGTFGIMDAVLMTDVINTSIFGAHTHIGNLGRPTTPTFTKMF